MTCACQNVTRTPRSYSTPLPPSRPPSFHTHLAEGLHQMLVRLLVLSLVDQGHAQAWREGGREGGKSVSHQGEKLLLLLHPLKEATTVSRLLVSPSLPPSLPHHREARCCSHNCYTTPPSLLLSLPPSLSFSLAVKKQGAAPVLVPPSPPSLPPFLPSSLPPSLPPSLTVEKQGAAPVLGDQLVEEKLGVTIARAALREGRREGGREGGSEGGREGEKEW